MKTKQKPILSYICITFILKNQFIKMALCPSENRSRGLVPLDKLTFGLGAPFYSD